MHAWRACAGPPGAYFTTVTYPGAAVNYARSVARQQSLQGIATVVQPNRPADIDARGSGAAGVLAGPPKHAEGLLRRAGQGCQARYQDT